MVILLITLMPLSYWGIQYLFDQDNVRMMDRLLPFAYGIVAAIPVILLQWALDVYFPLNWSGIGIYVFTFFNKEGILAYPVMVFLFILFRKKSYSGIPLRELTAWFCGFYFMISMSEAFILGGAVTPYSAVLLPFLRLFSLLLFTTLLVRILHCTGERMKGVYTAVYFILPFILNIIPLLELLNKSMLFYTGFIVMAIASVVLYYLESRGDLV